MKNLSETEILERLLAKREKFKVTHEEVISPDYEMWGRAREWHYHQGICLFAGLAPVSKPYFDLIINETSPFDLIHWIVYYPTEVTDRNRLKNIHRMLEQIPQVTNAKKHGHTIPPKALIDLCKGILDFTQFPPANLIEVINKFGPHPSLNLPSTFCPLEIDPSALENWKKFKERKNMPLAFNSIVKEEPPTTPPAPPVPSEAPLSIAKRLFPLKSIGKWEKADVLSLNEIVLLHYEIDPERIYETRIPGKPIEDTLKEFLDYLNRYFFGERQWFINHLDEDKLVDLLQRSIHAGSIKPSDQNTFLKVEIIDWMKSKNLSFPIRNLDTPEARGESSKDDLLTFDLKRLDRDQIAKLFVRAAAAAAWKENKSLSLQKVRKSSQVKEALKMACQIGGKSEGYDEKTIDDWIRDLNPSYSPKK